MWPCSQGFTELTAPPTTSQFCFSLVDWSLQLRDPFSQDTRKVTKVFATCRVSCWTLTSTPHHAFFPTGVYSGPTSMASLSNISVTRGYLWPETMKWKIPEINNSYFLNSMLFGESPWNLAWPEIGLRGLCSEQVIDLALFSTLYTLPALSEQVDDTALPCLWSSPPHFTL